MSQTYSATGINLKGRPIGENDRIITILTPEYGLIKAIAPGSRKINSSLGGRSNLFVTNKLLLVKGRSLDRIIQAETVTTYPHLTASLGQLGISQYLTELVLCQALTDQPQSEIYEIFCHYLNILEKLVNPTTNQLLNYLCSGIFNLLIIGGIAPQINHCCVTRKIISASVIDDKNLIPFSMDTGGILIPQIKEIKPTIKISHQLTNLELLLFQSLNQDPSTYDRINIDPQEHDQGTIEIAWRKLEHLLRDYIYYHLGTVMRSSSLITVI